MKIAVCFSGQPRFVTQVAPYILENLFKGYDVDVFAHLWFDENLISQPYKYGGDGGWEHQRISASSIEDFCKIYSPKLIKIDRSKSFKDSRLKTETCYRSDGSEVKWSKHWAESKEPNYRNRMVNNWLSNFYSLLQANLLRKEYEYANDFKYDYVVKCRTDSIVQSKIKYENYDPNKLHYTNILQQPDGMIADYLNFGGPKVMDVFMSSFAILDLVFENCSKRHGGAWSNEMLHRITLDMLNIEFQDHPIYVALPRF